MRRQSLKKQQERRVSMKLENAIKENIASVCEVCGRVGELDRHHIAAGCHRKELANFRSTIYCCRKCHQKIQFTPYQDQYDLACQIVARAINSEVGRNVIDV